MKTITELCNEVFVDICYYIEECQLSITLEKFEKIVKYAKLGWDLTQMIKDELRLDENTSDSKNHEEWNRIKNKMKY